MGLYDELRNQNVRITVDGDKNYAAGLFGKVKRIIEKVQGKLDLGVNEGFLKQQRRRPRKRKSRWFRRRDPITTSRLLPSTAGHCRGG